MTLRQRICGFSGHRFTATPARRTPEQRGRGVPPQAGLTCLRCGYESRCDVVEIDRARRDWL